MSLPEAANRAIAAAVVDVVESLPPGEAICLGCGRHFRHGDGRPCTCAAKVLVGGQPPRVEAA